MQVCKEADFYNGVCPALNGYFCNSQFPCGNKISYIEHVIGQKEVIKAKALLERCGYTVSKSNT